MNLLEKDIISLVDKYPNLSYINMEEDDYCSLYFINVDNINTTKFSKEEYELWEYYVENIEVITDTFEIYFSNDSSGYDYWKNRKDSNYTQIVILINNNFSDDNIFDLYDNFEYMFNEIIKTI